MKPDKYDFMIVVEDILDQCKTLHDIERIMLQMKMIILDVGKLKIEYINNMKDDVNVD